jgi:hypothetical protein
MKFGFIAGGILPQGRAGVQSQSRASDKKILEFFLCVRRDLVIIVRLSGGVAFAAEALPSRGGVAFRRMAATQSREAKERL